MFHTLYSDFCVFLAYFFMKMKCSFKKNGAMNCIFYSRFDCCIPFAFKESLCFLRWILHYFLCLKPLALFCRYYSLELEIYISCSWVGFGLFWTWNAWVIHVVLSLSFLGVILVSFCMLIFSVLGRKYWFFISLSISKRSFSFLSLFLYSQVCWMIFFSFVHDCLKF